MGPVNESMDRVHGLVDWTRGLMDSVHESISPGHESSPGFPVYIATIYTYLDMPGRSIVHVNNVVIKINVTSLRFNTMKNNIVGDVLQIQNYFFYQSLAHNYTH